MMRLLLLTALLAPLTAAAQLDETLLGAAVRTRPEFDGAKDNVIDVHPVIRYYGKPWFARTTQGMLEGGAQFHFGPGFAAGAQLAYEAGPRNGHPDASIGAHLEWDGKLGPAPVNVLGRLRQHVDTGRGSEADLRSTIGVYAGHGLLAGLFAQATWGNERNLREYYGLDKSGLLFTSAGALGSYELSRQWLLTSSFEARRVSDTAAQSPIVVRRTGYYANVGLAYRFR
jgi:outer membrane scaffolding protein for murein synthesis (MipA/OmpV family)